jgi:hypothetical protein
MGPLRLIVGVVGILAVSLVLILPPVDNPQTAFDETNTPIDIGAPAPMRLPFLKPSVQPRVMAEVARSEPDPIPMIDQKGPQAGTWQSRALLNHNLLQELLC